MSRPVLLLFAVACTSTPPGTDTGGSPPVETAREWRGTVVDGGFGARLATDGTRVWVGAPFADEVTEGTTGAVITGVPGSFFGAGLAWTAGGLAVGAPARGELIVDGAVALQQLGAAGVVAEGPGGWVVSTPLGWVAADGTRGAVGGRPDALVVDGADVVAGFAFGAQSTWRGSEPTARVTVADEAGAALLRCDTDGDGVAELVVGAPGAGVVWIAGSAQGPGTGRFGAALACGTEPGTLYVGAPAAGADHAGAVYRLRLRGAAEPVLTGEPFDELGTALAVAEGWLYAGAPGPASSPGRVLGVPEPSGG